MHTGTLYGHAHRPRRPTAWTANHSLEGQLSHGTLRHMARVMDPRILYRRPRRPPHGAPYPPGTYCGLLPHLAPGIRGSAAWARRVLGVSSSGVHRVRHAEPPALRGPLPSTRAAGRVVTLAPRRCHLARGYRAYSPYWRRLWQGLHSCSWPLRAAWLDARGLFLPDSDTLPSRYTIAPRGPLGKSSSQLARASAAGVERQRAEQWSLAGVPGVTTAPPEATCVHWPCRMGPVVSAGPGCIHP